MKLSEQVLKDLNVSEHYFGRDYKISEEYLSTLVKNIKTVEDENTRLKEQLDSISNQALDMNLAVQEMEQVLHKLHLGG